MMQKTLAELFEEATIKDSLIVQTEGKRKITRKVQLYNLDMAIAVGYRVNSKKATRFRPAITKHLKNIYDEEELTRKATVSKMEMVQIEGTREVSRLLGFNYLASSAGWQNRNHQPVLVLLIYSQ